METKKVQIRRKEENNYLPPEVQANSKKKIGSLFDGRQPLKGLNPEEEREYLPSVIGVTPDSNNWEEAVRAFWAEFFIDVPSGGIVLDITTRKDGKPVNLEDWIKYKWALAHKMVAPNEEAMRQNPNKKFYIYDPEEVDEKQNQLVNARKQAYKEFIKLTSKKGGDDTKLNRVFRMLTGINPQKLTRQQKENRLDVIVSDEPVRFYKVVTDKNLAVRAFLDEMLEYEVLQKVGNHVLFNDDVIGETTEEAIQFLKNDKNSKVITTLKSQLKEKKETTVLA